LIQFIFRHINRLRFSQQCHSIFTSHAIGDISIQKIEIWFCMEYNPLLVSADVGWQVRGGILHLSNRYEIRIGVGWGESRSLQIITKVRHPYMHIYIYIIQDTRLITNRLWKETMSCALLVVCPARFLVKLL